MVALARISEVAAPDDHVVTAKEALEFLYLRLEQEIEVQLLAAALMAGWSVNEALDAIDELQRDDIRAASGHRVPEQVASSNVDCAFQTIAIGVHHGRRKDP